MKSVWYFLYFQNKFHARQTAIQTNRQTHLYTHAYTPMLDTRIEDNYNINSIESCEMLMFYSKVFDVRRPKFHVFPIVLSILCALCVYGPVSKTRITGIESKPKTTTAKNTHITHAQKPAETLSLVKRKWQTFSLTTSATHNYSKLFVLYRMLKLVFFSRLSSLFFTRTSLPLRLPYLTLFHCLYLYARSCQLCSLLHDATFCAFCMSVPHIHYDFQTSDVLGEGWKIQWFFYSMCQSIEWCVCSA